MGIKLGIGRQNFVSSYGPVARYEWVGEGESLVCSLSECIESLGGQFNVVVLEELIASVGDEVLERVDSGENL